MLLLTKSGNAATPAHRGGSRCSERVSHSPKVTQQTLGFGLVLVSERPCCSWAGCMGVSREPGPGAACLDGTPCQEPGCTLAAFLPRKPGLTHLR